MSPEEVEKQVTFPIEVQMAGLPDMVELRSVSRFGFSLITAVFADRVDLYFARQLVLERLIAAKEKLPKGSDPVLGPIATGLSEIYQYTLEEENAPPLASPGEETIRLIRLRTIQDAIVRPFLKTVPGVTDINSFGGYVKQYQVQVDPDRLRKFDLSLKQVFNALAASNANAGGNVLEKGSEQALVRGLGLMQSVQDIEAVVLKAVNGTPVLVKDVATVNEGPASRWGAVLSNGKREGVAGIVLMIRGGSGREVVTAVKEKVAQLNAGGILPKGVTLKAFYDRTGLVRDCINTVSRAIAEGVLLVILVVYLFLRSFRGALIIAVTLPLVALATFITMRQVDLSANLMSLGGAGHFHRHDRGQRHHPGGKRDASLRGDEAGAEFRPNSAQRRPGGAETQPLRRADHRLDLSPHHDPSRHGGEDVRSPGLHRGHCAFGLPGAFHRCDPVPVLVCA
jgi:cobalt-zinc-cadmium resistance protein CzcA